MYKFLLIIFILVFSSDSFANIEYYDPEISTIKIPEIEFFDENNKKHLLEEFEGKVILLSFWATWCNICVNEIPQLDKLQKEFKKEPFQIIAMSEDFKGIDVVKEFYKIANIKYLKAYIDERNKLFNYFNLIGMPTSLVINRDGYVIAKITGAIDWNDDSLINILQKEFRNQTTGVNHNIISQEQDKMMLPILKK